ncbi:hypothetical protein HanXRQr2_Chr04g0153761 [Helianthus annuus]|uniref:Uncharacterized protein n=1 Tax=Helianthus annuus TaxID=4232 RepID=A0A9K3J5I2_HELAN|nr:hypothetical protein HanXRQr2_Chr04g0153761 [Helianthus annuus]KAJ0930333.1 hypothetical protein HanPSC8_Chr04g0148061 [Helianthus annuus]
MWLPATSVPFNFRIVICYFINCCVICENVYMISFYSIGIYTTMCIWLSI